MTAAHTPSPDTPARHVDLVDRVRAALGRGRADPIAAAPTIDESMFPGGPRDGDALAAFAEAATEAGMQVETLDENDLPAAIERLLARHQPQSVALGLADPVLHAIATDATDDHAITIVPWPSTDPAAGTAPEPFDLAITDVDGAIAETGSVALNARSERARGLALLPPVHVALVRQASIAPTLFEFFRRWERETREARPAATVLVTGPSKTGDIEGILVTGVHGPGDVHVLLVKDPPAAATPS
ncbi:MAG: LutC/YkgG family protein [Planctomycetota bacterium]|jgi:L-lactate dehydrogenase complex protein LldG